MTSSIPNNPVKRQRMLSIDIVRGLAMVVMALDHTRDFFTSALYEPTNLLLASPMMFMTRWVTNF